MNPVCSLIQDYFAIWLCGDIHVLHFQVQMSTWIFCHRPHTWILFALWLKTTLQSDFVVIIHFLHFQVQLSNWISCHRPHTWILFDRWFKFTLQSDFVVIMHVLQFQVQLSNWTFYHRLHIWILFALQFKITLQSAFVVIFMSNTSKFRCQLKSLVAGHTHDSCLLFDSKLLCNLILWW